MEKTPLSLVDLVELSDIVEDLQPQTELILSVGDWGQGLMLDDALAPCFWPYRVDQISSLVATLDTFVASGVLVRVVRDWDDDCTAWKLGHRVVIHDPWAIRQA